ncbi:hypothetical protein JTB14_036860 [Gonioctena quinquepunctata]|nr:hypothetical protein JTB14_036860 [Gonioctena quinquepunctata]
MQCKLRRLNYAPDGDPFVYRLIYTIPISQDCSLELDQEKAFLTNTDLPYSVNCQVWFPSQKSGHGLVIELTRLNVPCSRGFVHFSGLNVTQHPFIEKNYVHLKSHKQAHLCGKLEELPEPDRRIFFPSSTTRPAMHLQGNPVFAIAYHLVDHCYNVTYEARNGSFELKATGELECTFQIHLPYGNRVALDLRIGDSSVTKTNREGRTSVNFQDFKNGGTICGGLLTQLEDGQSSWTHCTKPGDSERQIEIVSRENKVVLKVIVRYSGGMREKSGTLGLKMSYQAETVEKIVGVCEFGWVVLRQFCVSAMEGVKLPWAQAEMECTRKGGHLASVSSDHDQQLLDHLLINRLTEFGENYGSVMLKVDITVLDEETKEEEMLYAVAKTLPETEVWRKVFRVQTTYTNEMAFYETIIPSLRKFQQEFGITNTLSCFAECLATRKNLLGDSDKIDDDAVLIFENLQAKGFINIDRFVGYDFETAKLVVRDMALFHAVALAFKKKYPKSFETKILPYCKSVLKGVYGMNHMANAAKSVLLENVAQAHWAPKVSIFMEKERPPPRDPFATLIHTDFWTNNTMQKFENGKPIANKIIDFQSFAYGSPAIDFFFFLWSSISQEVLEQHLDHLIAYYYDNFIQVLKDHQYDVTFLTFENFMKEMEIESEYEFGHAMMFSLMVVYGKKGPRDMEQLDDAEELLRHIPLEAMRKAWYMVDECEKRGWLK